MENSIDEKIDIIANGSTRPLSEDGATPMLDPNDPMNWSWLQKHSILGCVSLLGGLGAYAGLFIVPA